MIHPYLHWLETTQTNRILIATLPEITSQEALETLCHAVHDCMDTGQPPIHFIVDARAMQKFPTNVLRIRSAAQFLKRPDLGWVIVISTNRLIRTLATITTQSYHVPFYACATRDDAFDYLLTVDTTLHNSIADHAPLAIMPSYRTTA